ncbi:MAG: hypothetical protein GY943_24870, partial [Chloroflexi bacterium]|nr:hypothetical protein [Chloroflexota bacterium]
VRVRQAMMMCTNRQQIVDEVLYGAAELTHAYVPDNHPLMPTDLQQWPYDVAAANALLDEVGYTDEDGDGIRETTSGSPFQIALSSTIGGELRQAVSQVFVQNMRDCGIVVAEEWFPAGEMFADGPDGPVFGRQFDLALFAWLTNTDPHCNLWHSDNITGEEADGFGGWSNSGNTGWHNDAFDAACGVATTSLPGMSTYETAHQDALRIFAEDLPVMPLFFRLKISVTRPEVLNFHLNSSENSELWNLYEIDLLVD